MEPQENNGTPASLEVLETALNEMEQEYDLPALTRSNMWNLARPNHKNLHKQNKAGEGIRAMITCAAFNGVYEIVKLMNAEVFYYRKRRMDPSHPLDAIVMAPVTREELDDEVKRMHHILFPAFFESSELKKACNTVYDNIREKIMETDQDYIAVSDNLIFDAANKRLLKPEELPDPFPRVYHKMFDSDQVTGDQVKVEPLTPVQEGILLNEYNSTLTLLENGDFPQNIEEINDWACGEEDVYRDIIHMYSTAFMKNKPLGVFFPIGVGRNGKSSCIDLWASLVGTNYTARVPLDKMGDRHYLHALQKAVINIPDETGEDIVKDDATFRMVAAHSEQDYEKMASNQSIKVKYNFMMACPMNHVPKWNGGQSADTCVRRTNPIPFNADFSKSDLSGDSWGQKHFTGDFMAKLAGQVLAVASFYSDHDWEETPTMIMERQVVREETASKYVYFKLWDAVFDGFEKFELVDEDYKNWCVLRELEAEPMKRTELLWRKYTRTNATNPTNKRNVRVYRNRKEGLNRLVMMEDFRLPVKNNQLMNGHNLKDYQSSGGSIIYALEESGMLKQNDSNQVQLKLNI